MLGHWLTNWIEHRVARVVATMPPERREWGEAVVAELAAVAPGERRLRWALGGWWFVLRHRAATAHGSPADRPAAGWTGRVFAVLGVLTVLPWALFSVQGIAETDAPDATLPSMVGMLVAQTVLVTAFVATLWPWRPAPVLLVVALVGYAAAVTLGAADNDGSPLLAAPLFAGPPAVAALPIVLARVSPRRLT